MQGHPTNMWLSIVIQQNYDQVWNNTNNTKNVKYSTKIQNQIMKEVIEN